jgi:hypothetical protein
MTYEFLTAVVVLNAIATFALWRKISASKISDRPRLNKKAAKALWQSEPIVPRHNPPETAGGGKWGSFVRDVDRLFFSDFKDFADTVNWWLSDSYMESPFRLQDLPDDHLRLNVPSDSPTLGRAFAVYYNQTKLGRLEIHPYYKYSTESPEVYTSVEIDWARFIGFAELTEFLGAVLIHVTSQNPKNDERIDAWQSINRALTETLWSNYRISQYDTADDQDWGELNVSFHGTADFYIGRRDAPARPRTATAAAVPSNERSEKSGTSARVMGPSRKDFRLPLL